MILEVELHHEWQVVLRALRRPEDALEKLEGDTAISCRQARKPYGRPPPSGT